MKYLLIQLGNNTIHILHFYKIVSTSKCINNCFIYPNSRHTLNLKIAEDFLLSVLTTDSIKNDQQIQTISYR
jgi:hypothetical protein